MTRTCWPGTNVRISRGNAFDLTLPGLVDWSPFFKAAKHAEALSKKGTAKREADALAKKPASQMVVLTKSRPARAK